MHYRLARVSSPVIEAVLATAMHALTHAPTVERDVARMHKERAHSPAP
jgi:hypothetical protein